MTVLGRGNDRSATLNAVAVSTRVNAGAVSPCLAVVIPVDHDEHPFIDVALVAGVDCKIP